MMVAETLIPIVNFELFDEIKAVEKLVDVLSGQKSDDEPESKRMLKVKMKEHQNDIIVQEEKTDQMTQSGYESYNSIKNLGFFGLVVVFTVLKVLVYICLRLIRPCKPDSQWLNEEIGSMKEDLFFKKWFILFLETFLESLFVSILSMQTAKGSIENST